MKKAGLLVMAGILFMIGAGGVAAQKGQDTSADIQRAVFQVNNLTCGACFSNINAGLNPLDGFAGMGANLLRKMVAVDFKAPLTPEKIGETITGLGYPAALDSVESLDEKQTFAYMQSKRTGYGKKGACCGTAASEAQIRSGCTGSACGSGSCRSGAAPSGSNL